jgi:hypothetical protein
LREYVIAVGGAKHGDASSDAAFHAKSSNQDSAPVKN